jgi:Beta-propeller repeat
MRFASLFFAAVCAFAAPSMQVLPQPPVRFEQRPGTSQWSARGLGYSLAFTKDATFFRLGDKTLSMRLLGANPHATFEAVAPYSVPTEYFIPAYRGSVQAYHRLRRHQVYPGVDVVFYGSGRNLEYDFEIAADADPSRIRLRFGGADRLRVDLNGNLEIELAGQTLTQRLPVVYQTTASGTRQAVHAEYRLEANRDVSIQLDRYNRSAPLVIDPVISFAAYLNGINSDAGISITHDAQGFVYVAGNTSSPDFNTTTNGFSQTNTAVQNVWVMKLNPTAPPDQVIVYSTFYGGTTLDSVKGIAVDPANGLICITGTTTSTDLALTATALQSTNAGVTDGFVAAFNTQQSGVASLYYGSYIGGLLDDEPAGIAVFNSKIYITGSTTSDNFPVANDIFPGRAGVRDIFVSEIDPSQSGTASLIFSTYFGGTGTDYGRAIAVDALGQVYVAGFTYSTDIPITANPYQSTAQGGGDAFLLQLNTSLPLILYSSYLGGSKTDDARGITVDPTGKVALAGYTLSANFPVTQNAEQPLIGAGQFTTNAFLAILDLTQPAAQALVYGTYFGGSVAEVAQVLATDSKGKYVLGGYSYSPDMPVTQNTLNPTPAGGGLNGFVAVIDTTALPLNSLVYASYVTGPGSQIVNGADIDASGAIYVTGYATSDIFPVDQGQQAHTSAPGNADAYILIFTP